MADCIFCSIAAGETRADLVHEDEHTVAFNDLNPQAPTHVLVIPRRHVASVAALGPGDTDLWAQLLAGVHAVVAATRLDGGFRLVLNTGPQGGQTVDHLHVHVLGGRSMTWPPG